MPLILTAIIAGVVGLGIGFILRTQLKNKAGDDKTAEAQKLLDRARTEADKIHAEASQKSQKMMEEVKTEERTRRAELTLEKQRVDKREELYTQKFLELQNKALELNTKALKVEDIKKEIERIKEEQSLKLQEVAGLKKEEALAQLMARTEESAKEALVSRCRKLEHLNQEEVERKANDVIALAVMRFASPQAVETTTTTIHLPADDIKGRIIGKEGRNIKALELITGCEIVVDDTPGIITVSGFSPIRRHITKRSLDKLIKDGRIHPGRIEEAVEESKKELAVEMSKAGEDALYQLGIPVSSIDPKLVQILGRLKFRTSYGQNVLQHSIEVAQLSAMMAEELKANVFICKKGGLFHDIGKAVDHDMQGSHPEIGMNIMRKFGFPEEICYQSIGHHEDKPTTLEAVIVKAADAISGARPGARKNSLEQYVQRLEELEKVATRNEAVEKAYAIQAGREIRVFIHPAKMDDYGATQLAKQIAAEIEAELQYPGEIKVTVIRETRVMEYAR
ncbi:MAG: ribonuclease Y [bacterium]